MLIGEAEIMVFCLELPVSQTFQPLRTIPFAPDTFASLSDKARRARSSNSRCDSLSVVPEKLWGEWERRTTWKFPLAPHE